MAERDLAVWGAAEARPVNLNVLETYRVGSGLRQVGRGLCPRLLEEVGQRAGGLGGAAARAELGLVQACVLDYGVGGGVAWQNADAGA